MKLTSGGPAFRTSALGFSPQRQSLSVDVSRNHMQCMHMFFHLIPGQPLQVGIRIPSEWCLFTTPTQTDRVPLLQSLQIGILPIAYPSQGCPQSQSPTQTVAHLWAWGHPAQRHPAQPTFSCTSCTPRERPLDTG